MSRLKQYPKLQRGVFILPYENRWIVKKGANYKLIDWSQDHSRGERLLSLIINGHKSLSELSQSIGLSVAEVSALIEDLSAEGLLEIKNTPPESNLDPQAYFNLSTSLPVQKPPNKHLLLVGLCDLGLAVIKRVLPFENFHLHLLDGSPIEDFDVGHFFQEHDKGLLKGQVVYALLPKVTHDRVTVISQVGDPFNDLETGITQIAGDIDLIVYCGSQADPKIRDVIRLCQRDSLQLVIAQLTGTDAVIDSYPARTADDISNGCPVCSEFYRARHDPFDMAVRNFFNHQNSRLSNWCRNHEQQALDTVANMAVLAINRLMNIAEIPMVRKRETLLIDVDKGTILSQEPRQHFACPICFPSQDSEFEQSRERARAWWQVNCKENISIPTELGELWERFEPYFGGRFNLFDPVYQISPYDRDLVWHFFRERAVDPTNNIFANSKRGFCVRRSVNGIETRRILSEALDFEDALKAKTIAAIEGLERLFALDYCEPSRIVHARYKDVASMAMDPREMPLFSTEQYEAPTFGLKPFDVDRDVSWVWGVDLKTGEPTLVLYDLIYTAKEEKYYPATSNGAACHSSPLHAILSGLYETIERDALMSVWLNRISRPIIDVRGDDPDPFNIRQTLADLDFDLTLVDITTDLTIPVTLAVLRDKRNPKFYLVNMVSALNTNALLEKLYRELAQFLLPYLLNSQHYENKASLSHDAKCVESFPDHVAFYQNVKNQRYAAFLTKSQDKVRLGTGPFVNDELSVTEEIDLLVTRLENQDYRVLVVDCTSSFLKTLGMCALKVLVPGLQPLNAGHRYRHLGGPRALKVSMRMGLAERIKTIDELNPWPHPFW